MSVRPLLASGLWIVLLLLLPGCAQPAGVIFPPTTRPLVWPEPPDPPRIQYVGQLVTSADLKPAVPFHEALIQALFGKDRDRSMLSPFAVCTDGAQRLFVADSGAQAVHVFDLSARKYASLVLPKPLSFSQPVGVAYDAGAGGRIFVSDSVAGCIYVFDNRGEYLTVFGIPELRRPAGLCFDSLHQRLLVADTGDHAISAFSAEGKPQGKFGQRGSGPGQFNFPTNIVVDHQGRIYVSDTLNFRVQQFDADFKPLRSIGQNGDMPGSFSQPKGLAIDSQDHLYVLDAHFEAVQIFDPQGQLLLSFGREGHDPGQFWLPAGLCIDPHDRLWVADAYNRRVQVFDYKSEKQQ